eukprot:g3112.t1
MRSQLLVLATAAVTSCSAAVVKPNIVLILTDDQDIVLNEQLGQPLGPMAQTKALLQDQGAFGAAAYVNVPICCPSRATLLSGRYAHNLRDRHYEPFPAGLDPDPTGHNTGVPSCGDEPVEALTGKPLPCGCMRMNISSYGPFESQTFAARLKAASNYTTAYFGKYLNPPAMVKYCRNETLGPLTGGWPAGWDTFYGMCDQASTPAGAYYDVNWVDSEAGAVTYTGSAPEEYTTSVIGNKTVRWIERWSRAARAPAQQPPPPFLLVAATRAPHAPYLPPPWYADRFAGIASPRSLGSWNASTEGKAPWMGANAPLSAADAAHFDDVMRKRWGALLAVDDLVGGVVGALERAGVLNNTYVFFWSDHGYHLGSWRLAEGKMHFYDHDVRVPFLVRGPGIQPGLTVDRILSNADLAPTFLDIAGVPQRARGAGSSLPPIDGRSLLPLLLSSSTASAPAPAARAVAPAGGGSTGCDPDPCNGHGTCVPAAPNPCFCESAYAGDPCDRCAPGRSAYPACTPAPWRDSLLLEYYPIANAKTAHVRINDAPNNTFRAVRVHNDTHDLVYAEITDLDDWWFQRVRWRELYDMRADPFQLRNVVNSTGPGLVAQLRGELVRLWGCAGSSCP